MSEDKLLTMFRQLNAEEQARFHSYLDSVIAKHSPNMNKLETTSIAQRP